MEMTSKYGIRDESVESEAWAGLVEVLIVKGGFKARTLRLVIRVSP